MMIFFKKNNKGFILLYTILMISIMLAVALGLSNIATKEVSFSTSSKGSDEAFYAADTGIECALYYDQGPQGSMFGVSGGITRAVVTSCAGTNINISTSGVKTWDFILLGLGANQQGCARVTMDKTTNITTITSSGYNLGGDPTNGCDITTYITGRIERKIEVTY